jgi:glutathione S-transferase
VPAFKDGELLLVRLGGRRVALAAPLLDPCMPQTESGAALLYLAERYGKGSIGADSVEQRAVLARWVRRPLPASSAARRMMAAPDDAWRVQLFLANTTLCDDLAKKNPRSCDVLSALLAKQGAPRTHIHSRFTRTTTRCSHPLCHAAADYICGADFTLADCAVAVYLAWMPYWTKCDKEWVLTERWPLLEAYKQRVLSRPAGVANVPLAWLEDTAAWLV